MTGFVEPDTDGAVDFLEKWAPGGPWVVSAIEPDGPIQTRTFRNRQAAKKWIEAWQGKRNIYFSVNTPKSDLKKKASKVDIGAFNAFHVDLDILDGADPEQAKAAIILPRLKSYRLPPSIIIDSGGGLQAFWLMQAPVAVTGPNIIEQLEGYNRQLETDLGGDNCRNIDRIMRLPGTINLPNAVKRAKGRGRYLASVVEADWQRRYQIEQFITAFAFGDDKGGGKPNGKANGDAPEGEELDSILRRLPEWVIDRLRDVTTTDRSRALFSVIRKMIELDLDDTTIERFIRGNPSGIGSKYIGRRDLGAEIARVRAKTAASRKMLGKVGKFDQSLDEADIEAETVRSQQELEKLVKQFNRRYSVVNEAGKVWVFEWRSDPVLKREVLDRISHSDFRRLYENDRLTVFTKNGEKVISTTKTRAEWWLTHPARRQFLDGVTFDPARQAPTGYMNLWRGFPVEPRPGDWRLMSEHIEKIICAGKTEASEYVLNWLARLYQKPDQPGEVALVLRGKKGCGKGIFGRWVAKGFGQHGMQIFNPVHLVGRFNEHLRDCVLLFGDEAFYAGDKQHEGVLKGLITEPYLVIEGKYQRVVIVPNMLHIVLASNSDWVIPASVDERRYGVFDVPDNRVGDIPYFAAIDREMQQGGLAAMLYDLLARDITGFEVRDVPRTEALTVQKTLSLSSLQKWWLAVLSRSFIWKSRHGAKYFREWHPFYTTELLCNSYLQWCQEVRPFDRKSREELGRFMTAIYSPRRPRQEKHPVYELDSVKIGESLDQASIVWQDRPHGYWVGELVEARARFTEICDVLTEWGLDP